MSLLQSTDLIYQLTSIYLFATHRFPADCHCWFSGHLCFIGFGFKSRFFNYQSFQIILNFYAIVRVCFKLIVYQWIPVCVGAPGGWLVGKVLVSLSFILSQVVYLFLPYFFIWFLNFLPPFYLGPFKWCCQPDFHLS